MKTQVLKPGNLVSLHTRIEGGVQYNRVDIVRPEATDGAVSGTQSIVERWETTKVTQDPDEFDRASKVRSKCTSLIRSVCAPSAFGLLCPIAKEDQLRELIAQAQQIVAQFNATARTCRVAVFVLQGRIAESDSEATQAIASEMRALMEAMQLGITEGNVKKIRDAATKARTIGAMLEPEMGRKVTLALEEARAVAKEIVKRVIAGGEDLSAIVVQENGPLAAARFAFLDLETPEVVAGDALLVTAPRALDLDEGDHDAV